MPEIIVKLGDNILQKYFFVKETMNIGRAPDNQIVIENLAVSRSHALIREENGRYLLTDMDSSNGTFVNGVRVKKTELVDRDVVAIGKHQLYFYDQRAAETVHKAPVLNVDRTMMFESAPVIAPPEADLVIIKGRQKGQQFRLKESTTTIGRGSANDIRLTDWFISKEHAVIERRGSQFLLRDLGSWRRTMVNGAVIQETPLADQDTILFGPTVQATFSVIAEPSDSRPKVRVPVELAESPAPRVEGSSEPEPRQVEQSVRPDAEDEIQDALCESFKPEAEEREEGEPGIVPLQESASSTNGTQSKASPSVDDIHGLVENIAAYSLQAAALSAKSPIKVTSREGSSDPWAFLGDSDEPVTGRETDPRDEEPAPAGQDEPQTEAPATAAAVPEAVAIGPTEPAEEADRGEIEMWERALGNKNLLIRKQAARRLKQLTGRDYEY